MIIVLPNNNLAHLARPICGFASCCAIGEIYDEQGIARTVYVKAFPGRSRGLANEIVYWTAQRALEITSATAAWVVLVDTALLRARWPHVNWTEPEYACWATQEISNSSPEVLPVTDSPLVANELRNWPEVWSVIALHEWLANADGNVGNYIRLGPSRYAAIDGAEIFGGQYWKGEQLQRIGYIHNKLAHLIGAIRGHRVDPDAARQVLNAASRHSMALLALEQELIRWLSLLIGSADAHHAMEFLKQRIGLSKTRWLPDYTPTR